MWKIEKNPKKKFKKILNGVINLNLIEFWILGIEAPWYQSILQLYQPRMQIVMAPKSQIFFFILFLVIELMIIIHPIT